MTYELAFTGTQRGLTQIQHLRLSNWTATRAEMPGRTMHLGDCIGADAECWELTHRHYYTVGHPPIVSAKRAFLTYDEEREPEAYLDRNHSMVDEAGTLLACPGEMAEVLRSGTWATVRYARKLRRQIVIFYPDGSVEEEG
jgi:hypothetical protein